MSLPMLPYNPLELKLSIPLESAVYLVQYLNKCHSEAFTGINEFTQIHPTTEKLHRFNLVAIYYAIIYKAIAKPIRKGKKVSVKFTYSERLTLSILFQRVQVPPVLEPLQYLIIKNLQP